MVRFRTQFVFVVLVIVIALLATVALIRSRKPPQKITHKNPGPLVEVFKVTQQDVPIMIKGTGTVRAEMVVQLVPQVSGKVVSVSRNLRNGGFFRKYQTLVSIEPTDYELAVQAAEADLAQADVQLEIEMAEAAVAQQEWTALHPGVTPSSPLVTREPQVNRARAALKAAEAKLESAKLYLKRTRLTLPFNGRVISENVDIGQFIVAGQPVASVYGTNRVEIPVPLEDHEMAWFELPPGQGRSSDKGSTATISSMFSGARYTWEGKVVRTAAEIDHVTRMVHVIVSVNNPFENVGDKPPLTPGMFVEVEIKGKILENIIPVPRTAVHDGNRIWIVEEGKLAIREIQVVRKDRDWVYAVSGVESETGVIMTQLDTVADGMKIRIHDRNRLEMESGDSDIEVPAGGTP